MLPHIMLAYGNLLTNIFASRSGIIWAKFFSGEFENEQELQEYARSLGEKAAQEIAETGDFDINIDQVLKSLDLLKHPSFTPAAQGLLKAAVFLLWSAFEVLANDMWVACLNAYPIPLAKNAACIRFDEANASIDSKSVKTWLLYRYDFDLRSHMGTILQDKFKFTDIDGIREAYIAAFGESHRDRIKQIVGGTDLNFLESARHNIAHKAGTMDEKFLNRVKNYPDFGANEGEELPLTGILVSRLFSSAIESGFALVEFVDHRIANGFGDCGTR